MHLKIHILLLLISIIISTPPPIPQPPYEVSVVNPKLTENKESLSNFKNLEEDSDVKPKQFVDSTKVVVKILENGVLEEHEVNVTTKNLPERSNFNHYGFSITLPTGKSLELQSNTCNKLKLSDTNIDEEKDKCIISPINQNENTYKFDYNYTLFKEEYIIINYKILITSQTPEILYRQESISVSKIYPEGFCDYTFIIPDNYVNLGLQDNMFEKKSDTIYSYYENCPTEQINDVIRLAPKKGYWKADYSLYLESEEPNSNNITLIFPRMYKGGKNINKNYKITTYEDKVLKESDLIKDEIFLAATVPGKNKNLVGINLHTAFSNTLGDDFNVYTSESFYDIDEKSIDSTLKAKAEEIIKSQEYGNIPNYYKIGKFVHSHITYDLSYHGADKTPIEIYNEKKGVCEHYTILYNAMLNAIGIKTIKTFGWALDKDKISANENTIGHAWTVALIDGKFIELDATWNLFEGVPAGHILKGFNQENFSYSFTGTTPITPKNFFRRHNLQWVSNLDDEEENSNEEGGNIENTIIVEPKDSVEKGSENEESKALIESLGDEESNNGRNINISVYLIAMSLVFLL